MSPRVLILSNPTDLHAFSVSEALRRKGAEPAFWHTSDFPALSGETVLFGRGRIEVLVRSPHLEIASWDFRSVWHRRPMSQPSLDILHPADRAFATRNCDTFHRSLFQVLAPGAFWVNPPQASDFASRKIPQHLAAIESGLELPDTLYTNDPEEIRCFLAAQGGRAVFKILAGAPWRDGETTWVSYSSLITEEDLIDDDILRQTPGIYQALVPKAHELRVTFLGQEAFAVKVLSQETESGRLDWRKAYRELRMEKTEISGEIRERCLDLMKRLGIVFGCFDFIVTPEGRFVFLEVNEMGQFLFVEQYTGLPLLDAFCDFLIEGRPDFEYGWPEQPVRFSEIEPLAEEVMSEAAGLHVPCPLPGYDERVADGSRSSNSDLL